MIYIIKYFRTYPDGLHVLHGVAHTKLIAPHDIELVRALCPRIIAMFADQIQADGPIHDIFTNSTLLDACHL